MVADFHRRGVKVLFPMMMWDQGTKDPGTDWPTAFAEFMKQIDADGVNGDTQDGVPLAFSLAAEKAGHPLAFEPEIGPSDEALAWNVLTWGQYQYTFAPGVDKYRWLEPRHQVNIQGRWDRDKTNALQYAFFNGEGWRAGKTSGVSGTELPHATERQRAVWQPSSAPWLLFSRARDGSRSIRCCDTAFSQAAGRCPTRRCGRS
jgi:hypothetical protein